MPIIKLNKEFDACGLDGSVNNNQQGRNRNTTKILFIGFCKFIGTGIRKINK